MKFLKIILTAVIVCAWSPIASYAQAPTDEEAIALQLALTTFIEERTVDGEFSYFDSETSQMASVYPANLHPIILRAGDVFILCADFRDETGASVEIDFVATIRDDGPRILQMIVDDRQSLMPLIQG